MEILSLPDEISDLFVNKMVNFEDIVRYGAVCKSWQSSARRIMKNRSFAPWLMLVASSDDRKLGIQKLFSLSSNCIFNFQGLYYDKETRYWGSSFGWVVAHCLDHTIHLLNPFSGVRLPLPPQPTFKHQYKNQRDPRNLVRAFVSKAVLSSPPTLDCKDDSCVVLAINSEFRRLSYARPGDQAWTPIQSRLRGYNDAIFYQGHFYALTMAKHLVIVDINVFQPKTTHFASPPKSIEVSNKFYLVEMSGDLYFVERASYGYVRRRLPHRETTSFKFHKLDFNTRRWRSIRDIGGHAVFLGGNTSFAILAKNSPGCRPNCIYFTDDYSELYTVPFCDMGVYDFEKKTLLPIYSGKDTTSDVSRPLLTRDSWL
ncbi:SWR1-complex protein 3 [Ranunculus cassubicifolius]